MKKSFIVLIISSISLLSLADENLNLYCDKSEGNTSDCVDENNNDFYVDLGDSQATVAGDEIQFTKE